MSELIITETVDHYKGGLISIDSRYFPIVTGYIRGYLQDTGEPVYMECVLDTNLAYWTAYVDGEHVATSEFTPMVGTNSTVYTATLISIRFHDMLISMGINNFRGI